MGNPNGHLVHGYANTPLYKVWATMKQRCSNPKVRGYRWYGAKGVRVCPEWESFEPFHDWAISHGYQPELTLDRIDPNGDYEPANGRWVDWKHQQNNKTSNHVLTFKGETRTITEWAEITGISRTTIHGRLRNNWSIERTLAEKRKRHAAV